MLLNYKFKNYKSFFKESGFSMVANTDKSHEDTLESFGKDKVSKAKIIYGANASGKTSFIQSVEFMQIFATISNRLVDGNRIGIMPYAFTKDHIKNNSDFAITFVKDGTKYAYSFTCNADSVTNEKLDVYYTAKPTNIFTRTEINEYKFPVDVRILNDIKTKNTKNKLFLMTAATWNYEKVKPVVDYLLNDIVVMYDAAQPTRYNLDYVTKQGDFEEYKKFCLEFLNNADISIEDIEVETKKLKDLGLSNEEITRMLNMANINLEQMDQFKNNNTYIVNTRHAVKNNNAYESYLLPLNQESLGTQQLFELAPVLFYVLKEGKTLFIDEIDRSLHPILVKYIIKKFLNPDINKNNAQLICNTHETNMLDLGLFRRDEILFTDKDSTTGISDIYALSDFSPRKDENIARAYLLGRYGAIPFIKGE